MPSPPRPARRAEIRSEGPLPLSRRSFLQYGGSTLGAGLLLGPERATFAQAPTSSRDLDVRAFGATGQRADNATQAFQRAIDTCTSAGGGTVRVPPGDYTVGMIQLKTNVTLDLEAGATLFLSQENEQFPRGRRAMVY